MTAERRASVWQLARDILPWVLAATITGVGWYVSTANKDAALEARQVEQDHRITVLERGQANQGDLLSQIRDAVVQINQRLADSGLATLGGYSGSGAPPDFSAPAHRGGGR